MFVFYVVSGSAFRSGGHFIDCFQSSLSLNMVEAWMVELVACWILYLMNLQFSGSVSF